MLSSVKREGMVPERKTNGNEKISLCVRDDISLRRHLRIPGLLTMLQKKKAMGMKKKSLLFTAPGYVEISRRRVA